MVEENGYFAALDKMNKNTVAARLKTITPTKVKKMTPSDIAAEPDQEYGEPAILRQYLELTESLAQLNTEIKIASSMLNHLVMETYPTLTTEEYQITRHRRQMA